MTPLARSRRRRPGRGGSAPADRRGAQRRRRRAIWSGDDGVQLLPDARRPKRSAATPRAGPPARCRALGEVDDLRRASGMRTENICSATWQSGRNESVRVALVASRASCSGAAADLAHEVALADHRAPWAAGGARGVDEERRVVGLRPPSTAASTGAGCAPRVLGPAQESAKLITSGSLKPRRPRLDTRRWRERGSARAPPAPCRAAPRPRRTAIARSEIAQDVFDLPGERSDRCRCR